MDDASKLVRWLNLAYDNLWIMDFDGARTVVRDALAAIKKERLASLARNARRVRISLNKEGREKGIEESSLSKWRANRVPKTFQEIGLEQETVVLGSIAVRLEKLERGLKMSDQETLVEKDTGSKIEIYRTEWYKYNILSDPPLFEVRSVFSSPVHFSKLDTLAATLKNLQVTPAEPLKNGQSFFIRAFSNEEYVEILVETYTAFVRINMRRPDKNRAKILADAILNIFTKTEEQQERKSTEE